MIDFQVAYDKLAQFQAANDIAEYLKSCNVKAVRGNSVSCAISEWMKSQTGLTIRTTYFTVDSIDNQCRVLNQTYNTEVMTTFALMFDAGEYPELELDCSLKAQNEEEMED